jgi:predicted RNA-binding Zn ribbon-like protein
MVTVRREIPTGQWFTDSAVATDPTSQRWWFDSGSVAIDFAYAGGFRDDADTLSSPADLVAWLVARFPGLDGEASDRDLRDAHALQHSIAAIANSAAHGTPPAGADIDMLNLYAATPDIPPALPGGSRQAGRTRARIGQTFSAMAREAIEIFEAENSERVRECAADDCHLMFFDESRSNNRRWCSMQRCGNRAKVRAHRSREAADQHR